MRRAGPVALLALALAPASAQAAFPLDRGSIPAPRHELKLTDSPGAISFDVRLRRGASLLIGTSRIRAASHVTRHVELRSVDGAWRLGVDGLRVGSVSGTALRLSAGAPSVRIDNLLATAADRPSLLLHRLSALRAAAAAKRAGLIPRGADSHGRLRFTRDWMMGFWGGALWHAYDLTGRSSLFKRWAIDASLDTHGRETADTHDLGFIYGESAAAGYRRLCEHRAAPLTSQATCGALLGSALKAARHLRAMARRNAAAGMLPTALHRCRCPSGEGETIIDAMMNLGLLFWASEVTGDPSFKDIAARHARRTAELLVRADGSTAQSVHYVRATGRITDPAHTHQGLGDGSTWARGQAWALYGFAQAAAATGDAQLLDTARRIAAHFAAKLGDAVLPRWDLDAPAGPTDGSAAAIASAGLERLAALDADPRWPQLAARLRGNVLQEVSPTTPLGRLAGQVYTYGGSDWDENAEFLMGIDYVLESASAAARR